MHVRTLYWQIHVYKEKRSTEEGMGYSREHSTVGCVDIVLDILLYICVGYALNVLDMLDISGLNHRIFSCQGDDGGV